MPGSNPDFKNEIKKHFYNSFNGIPDMRILDFGPGLGTYAQLLSPDFKMDCVEIFEPYINQYNLKKIYENVYLGDIRTFDTSPYDYIIMGDVLEHLSHKDSVDLLKRIEAKKYLIAVPYLYPQGTCYGNVHETHLQPELTEALVISRYNVKKLYGNNHYGYFINY